MKAASVRAVLSALRDAGVRYLVADGLAVNAYGFLRFTKDADLVIELIPENINAAFNALASLGYKPGVPITAEQFANPQNRESWIREKDMKVLQFWSAEHRQTPLDIFIHIPFDFETEFTAASTKELREIGPIPIVNLAYSVSHEESCQPRTRPDRPRQFAATLSHRGPLKWRNNLTESIGA